MPLPGVKDVDLSSPVLPAGADAALASDLRRMLGGHAYLLWIAFRRLQALPDQEQVTSLTRLLQQLSSVDRDRRRHVTLEWVLHGMESARKEVLVALSLLTRPASPTTIAAVLHPEGSPEAVKGHLAELEKSDLVLIVGTSNLYTAHTVVRSYFLNQMGVSDAPGESHRFTLSGYSAEVPLSQPGTRKAHTRAARSVDQLLALAEEEGDPTSRLRALRAALGIARSRWAAPGIARLGAEAIDAESPLTQTHYGAYMRRLSRMLNAARNIDGDKNAWAHWDQDTSTASPHKVLEQEDGAFLVDELAWIYNELGLAAFARGSMHDAQALFRMGRGVNELAEQTLWSEDLTTGRRKRGSRWAESQINLGIVSIERGKLNRARTHFGGAFREVRAWGKPAHLDLASRIEGHLALVLHLSGEYEQADAQYAKATAGLQVTGNHRALSLFWRHHADLCRVRQDSSRAASLLQQSIAAAESARHHDLLQYALVAEAHLETTLDHACAAAKLSTLRQIELLARETGSMKLERETLRIQARIALWHGDVERASRLTLRALGIASFNGLGLALTGSLVLMAEILAARGEPVAARHLLRSTLQLAERQRYQLQADAAQRELMRLGADETIMGAPM